MPDSNLRRRQDPSRICTGYLKRPGQKEKEDAKREEEEKKRSRSSTAEVRCTLEYSMTVRGRKSSNSVVLYDKDVAQKPWGVSTTDT